MLKMNHLQLNVDTNKQLTLLPNDTILDWSKFKAFADDILDIAKMTISLSGRVENTVEKGEIAGYQHFFLFSTVFSKAFFSRVVKSRDCMVKS